MNKKHLVIPMIGAGLALGGVLGQAGSFSSDFSDPGQTDVTLTSNDATMTWMPTIADGHLVLTPAENSRQGSMILDALDGRTAIGGFTASFKLQIGPGSGNAADGFAFSFGPELTDTSNFGEEGLGTGITVCFDIYNNGTGEAPAIDVKYRGTVVATTKYAKADMVTGQFEDVTIELVAGGRLNVTWKGIKVYENLALPGFKPLYGRFAVGARTGGENANQWVDDLSITTSPVPEAPPSLVWAGGSPTFTTVRVGFDEPVDPTTAGTTSNYQLSGGVTVLSAALAAASGTAGDNVVVLTTSQQPEDTLLTLTVNNVEDLSGNAVPTDSTAEFRTFVWLPGVVTWERWDDGISIGNLYAQATDPNDPRAPGMKWLASSFESGRHIGAPEFFGARGYAWFTPATAGEYEFLLTCDDNGRALLSTDADPANIFGIAAETGASGERTWTSTAAGSEQYSYTYLTTFDDSALGIQPYPGWGAVTLEANQKYFLEVLFQEATSGDGAELTIIKAGGAIPADGTPADTAGGTLGCYYDPNTELAMVTQPTDQVGVLGSTGVEIYSVDFAEGDGGFTVENSGEPPANWGPWEYSAAEGQWVALGSDTECGGPFNSNLTSPGITLSQAGTVTLNFTHRYRLEGDLWDAGLLRVSVNGGGFMYLPAENFSANGYAEEGTIIGNGIAQGLLGFNGDSPGFADGALITSTVSLGTFQQNDTIVVQFVGAWDDCWSPGQPGWVIDSMNLEQLPMVIVDFAEGDGGFTVENSGEPPANWGPWAYSAAEGQWVALGSDTECGGPFNSNLTSPAYPVPVTDDVTLNFTHRYRLEGDLWDAGLVRVSVNGGEFVYVPAENFSANGYAEQGTIIGNGIAQGLYGFNGDSPGFADGDLITSSVILGSFNQGDTIAVQFVGAWDDCWSPGQPGWLMQGMELVFGKAAQASTFNCEVSSTLRGDWVPVNYQWQRDDGTGFVDIPGASNAALTIYPVAADFDAMFRVMVTVGADPTKLLISNEVKLITGEVEAPTIGISATGGVVTVTFTGTLQSAEAVDGPYADVAGATSPYAVPAGSAAGFFRSMR